MPFFTAISATTLYQISRRAVEIGQCLKPALRLAPILLRELIARGLLLLDTARGNHQSSFGDA
jgi:hypothetical protein